MKDKTLTLIRDAYGRICWLGGAVPKPDKDWLKGQTIPFLPNAVFHSAYPLDGGSVIVDLNDVEILGEYDDWAAAGKPRHSVLVATWYALRYAGQPINVPKVFRKYYGTKGKEMFITEITAE